MIEQTFGVANRLYEIVQYKQKNLILNTVADETDVTDKKQNTIAGKKLDIIVNKAIDNNEML